MWIMSGDADEDIKEVYIRNFKEIFTNRINNLLEKKIENYAENMVCVMFTINSLNNMVDRLFIKKFLEVQIDNFENYIDDESSDDSSNNSLNEENIAEDNPSHAI